MAKKKKTEVPITPLDIMSRYMSYVGNPSADVSLDDFFQSSDIVSALFYSHFEDQEQLEREIWTYFMKDSIQTVEGDINPEMLSVENKLLGLFFTFFQNVSLNQEYFKRHLALRKNIVDKSKLYAGMKDVFHAYLLSIYQPSCQVPPLGAKESIETIMQQGFVYTYWAELVLLIEFWLRDESPEFQKTDVAIEKSLKATHEVRTIQPLRSVIDLGLFLWKERFTKA